jgi:hypothetical protein
MCKIEDIISKSKPTPPAGVGDRARNLIRTKTILFMNNIRKEKKEKIIFLFLLLEQMYCCAMLCISILTNNNSNNNINNNIHTQQHTPYRPPTTGMVNQHELQAYSMILHIVS